MVADGRSRDLDPKDAAIVVVFGPCSGTRKPRLGSRLSFVSQTNNPLRFSKLLPHLKTSVEGKQKLATHSETTQ